MEARQLKCKVCGYPASWAVKVDNGWSQPFDQHYCERHVPQK